MKGRNGEGRDCGWRNITGGRARVESEIRLNEREERVSQKARGGGREESNGIWGRGRDGERDAAGRRAKRRARAGM